MLGWFGTNIPNTRIWLSEPLINVWLHHQSKVHFLVVTFPTKLYSICQPCRSKCKDCYGMQNKALTMMTSLILWFKGKNVLKTTTSIPVWNVTVHFVLNYLSSDNFWYKTKPIMIGFNNTLKLYLYSTNNKVG